MIKIYNKTGDCVSMSKNLRGILSYAIKAKPINIVLHKYENGAGLLKIRFLDYAHTSVIFVSFEVMNEWVKARKSWKDSDFTICN